MKTSTAMAKILKIEGVKFVSVFPSAGAAKALINSTAEEGIRTILARQERVAINIADGYSRVSGKNGVSIVTGGVGIENAFSGVSQAFSDLVPILVLAGQSTSRRLGARPLQDFDTCFNYQKITKWVERINYADRAPEMMRRAFTYLRTGRPSPVVLEIPNDVAEEELDDEIFDYKPVADIRSAGDPSGVKLAVRALLRAEQPLIYAGEGVLRAHAWKELREFAEAVQAPVMTTLKGKSVFPENNPLSVGQGGRTGGKTASHFLRKADLILSIGASLTRGHGAPIPKGKVIIQSTIDELDVNREYMTDLVIMGDAKLIIGQLIDETKEQLEQRIRPENSSLIEEIRDVKEKWLEDWMTKLTSNEVPLNPYRIFWDLMHTVDRENTIITHDAGMPRDQLAPFYEAITPWGYIGWGHHSTLGYSLGAAIGAKLACPEKLVVNVMGDGAFGMVGMDFETAVRNKLGILTILLNNSGMAQYFEMTPTASLLSGSYLKVVEGLGGYAERVEKPDEIVPAVKRAMKYCESGRASMLEFITKVDLSTQVDYWKDLYEKERLI